MFFCLLTEVPIGSRTEELRICPCGRKEKYAVSDKIGFFLHSSSRQLKVTVSTACPKHLDLQEIIALDTDYDYGTSIQTVLVEEPSIGPQVQHHVFVLFFSI